MIADRLRQAVLEAAISGKLTEQRPEDGTGAELAELVAEARKELFSTSKQRKQKALPANDVVYQKWEIPESWNRAILDDVTIPADNRNPEDTGKENIKYVDIGSVPGPTRLLDDVDSIDAATAPSRARQVVKGGDTVFSTVRPYLEKIAFIDTALNDANIGDVGILQTEAVTNQAVCACITYAGVSPAFVETSVKALKDYFIDLGAGGAQPNISREKIIAAPIPLPPTPEQERIAAKVDLLLPLVASLRSE